MSMYAIKLWNAFSITVIGFVSGSTRARAVCHFDFMTGEGGGWWNRVFWGEQRRGVMREISYIGAGCFILSQMWVWLDSGLQSDIICSGKWSDNNNKVSFVMMGPYRLINHLWRCPHRADNALSHASSYSWLMWKQWQPFNSALLT